jgi:RNA polymerase sigma factor (sigma-70 family)
MMCIEFDAFLSATIDGEIPPDQWREAKGHVMQCPRCIRNVAWLEAMDRIIAENTNGNAQGTYVDQVTAAIENLPPDTVDAYHLLAFEGLDYDQIAERLGIARSAVFSLISRARKRLQADLELIIHREFEPCGTPIVLTR